jgi:hypothetical protein
MKLTPAQRTTLLVEDPNLINIGNLPSNFFPYDFKELYIKPFTVTHLKLLSRAHITKNTEFQKRAVDAVITEDVNELTPGDYFYILEWLKINSTTKTPVTIEWTCPETRLKNKETSEYILNTPDALKAIENDEEKLYDTELCGKNNVELIYAPGLNILQLPEDDWAGLPEGFDFPRMRDFIDIQEALTDPELNLIAHPASWVVGNSLAEKITTLEACPNLDMFNQALALSTTLAHGISHSVTTTCQRCQSKHTSTISIGNLSFFQ